jgi:hypothetical protein
LEFLPAELHWSDVEPTVHKHTDSSSRQCHHPCTPREGTTGEHHMLFIFGTVIVLAAIMSRMQERRRADLGWMSSQWLAEHRASDFH